MDIHKKFVVACIMGKRIKKEIRTYRTFTEMIKELLMDFYIEALKHIIVNDLKNPEGILVKFELVCRTKLIFSI